MSRAPSRARVDREYGRCPVCQTEGPSSRELCPTFVSSATTTHGDRVFTLCGAATGSPTGTGSGTMLVMTRRTSRTAAIKGSITPDLDRLLRLYAQRKGISLSLALDNVLAYGFHLLADDPLSDNHDTVVIDAINQWRGQ